MYESKESNIIHIRISCKNRSKCDNCSSTVIVSQFPYKTAPCVPEITGLIGLLHLILRLFNVAYCSL